MKMPPNNPEPQGPNLSSLYSELNRLIIIGDHEKTLKTCNRILHQAPEELKAFQCKVVSFIQLGKFSEAINAIHHAKQNDQYPFEIAYCYYRLNKPDEAYKVLEEIKNNDPRIPELKAQILYRLERFDECKQVYTEIIKNSHDDYQDERETNLAAVLAGLVAEKGPKAVAIPELRDDTYELCYNKACKLIAEENYSEAERMLKKCEKLCMEQLLDEEEAEEEIEDELAIVRVQLGYCLQMQGKEQDAQALYQRVLKNKPDDATLLAVAANNCVVINATHNVFDSKKKLKIATSEAAEPKLNSYQRKIIAANNCLFNIINGVGNYKTHCDALLKKYPDMEFTAVVGMALGKLKEGKDDEVIEYLLKYGRKDPKNALYIHLFAAHVALMKENHEKAIDILLNLGDEKFLPGIVGTLVTIYLGKGMPEKASKYLDETVDWYRKNRLGKPGLEKMYREAADFHMRNEEPEAAAKCFEEILLLHPNSKQIIAQLVMAYAQIKSPKAKALSDRLPPIDTSGLDVDDLESANWMMGLKVNRPSRQPGTTADTPPTTPRDPYKKKSKKKRRGKLPKNYVQGEQPDPERWLPKYERTGFRKKRDRRAKEIIKGSQGSATNAASEVYDYSGHSSVDTKTVETPSPATTHQKTKHTPQTHKKKKGRR